MVTILAAVDEFAREVIIESTCDALASPRSWPIYRYLEDGQPGR